MDLDVALAFVVPDGVKTLLRQFQVLVLPSVQVWPGPASVYFRRALMCEVF